MWRRFYLLTHWNKLFNTDCVVIEVGDHIVYPIFRNGWSTMNAVADSRHVNEEIAQCQHIDVLIRKPKERFVSGVNEYCRQNNLDLKDTYKLIVAEEVMDRHFTPQSIWLLHLYKYYKGKITLRDFAYIKNITEAHHNKSKGKIDLEVPDKFTDTDEKLIPYIDKTVSIGEIIKNVLP